MPVADELTQRGDRPLERRRKQAAFRDPQKTLDHFDFNLTGSPGRVADDNPCQPGE